MEKIMKMVFAILIGLIVVGVMAYVLVSIGFVQIGQGGWAVALLSTLSQIFNILGV